MPYCSNNPLGKRVQPVAAPEPAVVKSAAVNTLTPPLVNAPEIAADPAVNAPEILVPPETDNDDNVPTLVILGCAFVVTVAALVAVVALVALPALVAKLALVAVVADVAVLAVVADDADPALVA